MFVSSPGDLTSACNYKYVRLYYNIISLSLKDFYFVKKRNDIGHQFGCLHDTLSTSPFTNFLECKILIFLIGLNMKVSCTYVYINTVSKLFHIPSTNKMGI